jgi:hypothetical protein
VSAAKTGAARGRSRTRRERLLPLLPLLSRRRAAAYFLFLLAGKPHRLTSPTRFTSTSGYRGEDARFFPLVDATTIEPRENTPLLRAATPPLVMPAFVPGWDAVSCRCRCLHRRALAR